MPDFEQPPDLAPPAAAAEGGSGSAPPPSADDAGPNWERLGAGTPLGRSVLPEGDHGDVIVIADPSAEGEAITSALRARGYTVVDAPVALLESRVAGESPRVLIVDVDQPGAVPALQRLRATKEGAAAEIICVGDPARAADVGATRDAMRAFERPVEIEAILAQVIRIAEPSMLDHRARGTTPPPSYAPRRETSRPSAGDSESPSVSELPAIGDPLDVASMLPGMDDATGLPRMPAAQLSPELEELLVAAERRVVGHGHPSSIPSPDEEVDLILSPEMLSALDDPLEPEEDDLGTGSGLGTGGTPHQGTTAPKPGTTTGLGTTGGGLHGATTGAAFAAGATGTGASGPGSGTAPGPAVGTHAGARTTAEPFEAATGLVDSSTFAHVPLRASDPGASADDETGEPRPVAAGTPAPFDPMGADRPPGLDVLESAAMAGAASLAAPTVPRPAPPSALASRGAAPREATPWSSARTPEPRFVDRAPAAAGSAQAWSADEAPVIPAVLGEGDAVKALARSIAGRASGSLALHGEHGIRRIVLHDGDIVTAGSGIGDETLLAFLVARGDIEREVLARLAGKLPPFGRHAGAALIAHGHLGQDDLWPVLRAHAEWTIGRALTSDGGTCELEEEPPGRLKAEPSVFGGATGAEVFVEAIRRVLPPELALRRIGGAGARLDEGRRATILGECALRPDEVEIVRAARGRTAGEVAAQGEPELANVIYALVALGVLDALAPAAREDAAPGGALDPFDEEALRQRVRARLALVEDGDYFAVLGVPRSATAYEIRRAYLELRRGFEPSRLLTAQTADLAEDVRLVVEVLDEAYEILRDRHRRERYRKAIEAGPPA